jgi:hypothetical protein
MTKRIDELVQSICGPGDHPLAPLLRGWAEESRLFLGFAEANATKIRKKARLAALDDALADLLAELAIAALLLRDRRFTLCYEAQRPEGGRAPDFQVGFKAHSTFHVEVTRLRPSEGAGAARLARVICDKSGQLPPGAMNVLAVVLPPAVSGEALAPTAVRLLDSFRQPGASPTAELRLENVQAYLRYRQRISAIALCALSEAWRPLSVWLWSNPQARHPLQPEIKRYLVQTAEAAA